MNVTMEQQEDSHSHSLFVLLILSSVLSHPSSPPCSHVCPDLEKNADAGYEIICQRRMYDNGFGSGHWHLGRCLAKHSNLLNICTNST